MIRSTVIYLSTRCCEGFQRLHGRCTSTKDKCAHTGYMCRTASSVLLVHTGKTKIHLLAGLFGYTGL